MSIAMEPVPGGKEHILLVDDEEQIVRLVQLLLERFGYRSTGLTSSVEALERFGSDPFNFDLVITDQFMPGMTGLKLADELIALRPDIPIILITGTDIITTDKVKEEKGIRACLVKPFKAHELDAVVRRALDQEIEN